MALSKTKALRLASNAMDLGAVAWRGTVSLNEDDRISVGDRDLMEWFKRNDGQEVLIVLTTIEADTHELRRQCGVCGREYEGAECPHCARARARLRGG